MRESTLALRAEKCKSEGVSSQKKTPAEVTGALSGNFGIEEDGYSSRWSVFFERSLSSPPSENTSF